MKTYKVYYRLKQHIDCVFVDSLYEDQVEFALHKRFAGAIILNVVALG